MEVFEIVKLKLAWEFGGLVAALASFLIVLLVLSTVAGLWAVSVYVRLWLGYEWYYPMTPKGRGNHFLISPRDKRHSKYKGR